MNAQHESFGYLGFDENGEGAWIFFDAEGNPTEPDWESGIRRYFFQDEKTGEWLEGVSKSSLRKYGWTAAMIRDANYLPDYAGVPNPKGSIEDGCAPASYYLIDNIPPAPRPVRGRK